MALSIDLSNMVSAKKRCLLFFVDNPYFCYNVSNVFFFEIFLVFYKVLFCDEIHLLLFFLSFFQFFFLFILTTANSTLFFFLLEQRSMWNRAYILKYFLMESLEKFLEELPKEFQRKPWRKPRVPGEMYCRTEKVSAHSSILFFVVFVKKSE